MPGGTDLWHPIGIACSGGRLATGPVLAAGRTCRCPVGSNQYRPVALNCMLPQVIFVLVQVILMSKKIKKSNKNPQKNIWIVYILF